MRLIVLYMSLHIGFLALADVGRVADNDIVQRTPLRRQEQHVALPEPYLCTKHPGISPRHGKGFGRNVPSLHLCFRQGKRHTHGNAPATRAAVEHPLRTTAADKLHQQFRLGTGDEHVGVDFETLSAERGFARGILQRLPGLKGCKGTLQAGFGIGTELHTTVHQDIGARSTEQVVKQGKGRGLNLGKA